MSPDGGGWKREGDEAPMSAARAPNALYTVA